MRGHSEEIQAESLIRRLIGHPIVWILPALIYLLFFVIYPLIFTLYYSFCSYTLFIGKSTFVGVENYVKLLTLPKFWQSLSITLLFVAVCVTVEFLLGLGLALIMSQHFKGRSVFRMLFLMPMFATPAAIGAVFRCLYNYNYGWMNYFVNSLFNVKLRWLSDSLIAPFSLMIIDIWQWTPFMMLILLAGIESLPREPYEVAQLSGASSWQVFRYITLPYLRQVILVAIILRVMDAFKVFDIIWTTTQGGPGSSTDVLSLYAYRTAFMSLDIGTSSALAWIMAIVIMIIVTIFLRYVRLETR